MGVGIDPELFFQDYDFFKDFKNHSFVTNVLSRSPLLSGVGDDKYNCIVQQQMHSTGDFFFHTFDETLMDVCCMCFVSCQCVPVVYVGMYYSLLYRNTCTCSAPTHTHMHACTRAHTHTHTRTHNVCVLLVCVLFSACVCCSLAR